ncbi:MAG: DivIVA domain-containing protein [Clostridia bacterium]|nr:DivIVA domain-containing protein [Clostridia bacterium]
MLTPLEIENRKFKKEISGYSKIEVEEFMHVISENYELIYKENLANKDKINMLSNAIKQYKTMEEALQSAILVAQSAGDEVVQNAKKKAENIIADAETKAAQLLSDASREVTRVSYEYEEMKRNVEVFRTRIISLLTSQLDIVKEFDMPMPASKNIKVETKHVELDPVAEEQPDKVVSAFKKLERVTMELPKITVNEKGEYVSSEPVDTNDAETGDSAE